MRDLTRGERWVLAKHKEVPATAWEIAEYAKHQAEIAEQWAKAERGEYVGEMGWVEGFVRFLLRIFWPSALKVPGAPEKNSTSSRQSKDWAATYGSFRALQRELTQKSHIGPMSIPLKTTVAPRASSTTRGHAAMASM